MSLIIDGHNLIPKIQGLALRQMDDEEKLTELLQAYARLRRKQVEVYFDGAPPGHTGPKMFGMVQAHFVPQNNTADEAIRRRLSDLGRAARNITVVTSDRMVQAEARRRGAGVVSSEEFARDLEKVWNEDAAHRVPSQAKRKEAAGEPEPGKKPAVKKKPVRVPPPAEDNPRQSVGKVPPGEVEEWLKIFNERKPPEKKK